MPGMEQKLEYVDGDIEGVEIRRLKCFNDKRGWLVEIFRHDELVEERWPTMMYVSSTLPGVAPAHTSMSTRRTGSRSSVRPTFGCTCGTLGRAVRPRDIGPSSPWERQTRRPPGFHPEWFTPIAMWATFPVWCSTHPTGCTPVGARKSRLTRFDMKRPSRASSPWIDGDPPGRRPDVRHAVSPQSMRNDAQCDSAASCPVSRGSRGIERTFTGLRARWATNR